MSNWNAAIQLLKGRRSIRRYKDEPVSDEIIQKIIGATAWAPSASNRQDWEFVVIRNDDVKEKMRAAVGKAWSQALENEATASIADEIQQYSRNFDWFTKAPVVIAVTAREPSAFLTAIFVERAEAIAGSIISGAMAAQNLMLAAHAIGLGSCCLTGPLAAEGELKSILEIGSRRKIICLLAAGWPGEEPSPPPRKAIDQIMRVIE